RHLLIGSGTLRRLCPRAQEPFRAHNAGEYHGSGRPGPARTLSRDHRDGGGRGMSAVVIHPVDGSLHGEVRVPRSKPHMQRAIVLSLLTNAPSTIVNPAWSSESQGLYHAAQRFGMEVGNEDEAWVVITGAGRSLSKPEAPLWAAGSAFNFRTLVALACLVPAETVIEGNSSLRARPVIEYLNFVRDLGAWMEDISDKDHLRARVRGCRRLGGET